MSLVQGALSEWLVDHELIATGTMVDEEARTGAEQVAAGVQREDRVDDVPF